MFKIIKKVKWFYALEVVLVIIIFNISLKTFLIYAFIRIIIQFDIVSEYLRKLIRVFHVENEIKISAIIKKLKITEKELTDIKNEIKDNAYEKDWESYEKDAKDIRNN